VEVVLAVGVVAFAFVAVLGLLPAGMTQFRQAVDTSVCAQIAQRIIMDAQQADFDILTDKVSTAPNGPPTPNLTFRAPSAGAGAFRYFDEQGNEVVFTTASPSIQELSQRNVIYHVNTRIGVTTDLPVEGVVGGSNNPDLATVTVEVVFNPSNRPLAIEPGGAADVNRPRRNLVLVTPGLNVKTYGAQVGRNQ
jgi:uncharacterized protein (TIGR02598 family)